MINHSLTMSASHVVRLYLWDMLRTHMPDTWAEVESLSDMPIIPTQEQPEEQTSGKPYIVYTYDYMSTTDLWQLQIETFYARILSQSAATIAATTKLMVRLFNRLDDSASDLNDWIHNRGRFAPDGLYGGGLSKYEIPGGGNEEYNRWMDEARNFKFLVTRMTGVTGVEPAAQEGGRVDSVVSIELRYVERDHAGNDLNLSNDN